METTIKRMKKRIKRRDDACLRLITTDRAFVQTRGASSSSTSCSLLFFTVYKFFSGIRFPSLRPLFFRGKDVYATRASKVKRLERCRENREKILLVLYESCSRQVLFQDDYDAVDDSTPFIFIPPTLSSLSLSLSSLYCLL